MLAYVLAFVVGLGSFALYMAAFFFPEIHRKYDLIWSGVGLFYALVLWVCADRISGGVLLGQTASVALLGWLGWQTLTLRRQISPSDQQTAVPTVEEVKEKLSELAKPETISQATQQVGTQLAKLPAFFQALLTAATKPKPTPKVEPQAEPYKPLTPADFATARRGEEAVNASIEPDTNAVIDTEAVESVEDPWLSDEVPADSSATIEVPSSATSPSQKAASTSTKPTTSPQPSKSSTAELSSKVMGTATNLGNQLRSVFQGLIKKREDKPVYVRKQFREPSAEVKSTSAEPSAPEVIQDEPSSVEPEFVKESALNENEAAIAQETSPSTVEVVEAPEPVTIPEDSLEQAVPPHPPDSDLVESAIADAEEKNIPTAPPSTSETLLEEPKISEEPGN